MLANLSERQAHQTRWCLTIGWGILIASLFYDPISVWLTQPIHSNSPFSSDLDKCVQIQGTCLLESPYPLGAPIFWSVVVPASIFILLVLGHEFWRRICPLSFISQIPRSLGWERKQKFISKTGKVRYVVMKVDKDSWLARNHFYVQFGLFFLGLCSRILFVDSDRLTLGFFLIATIMAALTVGFFYGGKTWCQYFCPMAPVQKFYSEPRGLLNSTAHEGDRQPISQSMCRTVTAEGKELSACVACQSPCIDIDAERSYWEGIKHPQQQWLHYGYVGMVIGYFVYYYLYAGNWDYYFSGVWSHDETQLAQLFNPGFFLLGHPIAIPKLVAVPMCLAVFGVTGYALGRMVEKRYKAYQLRHQHPANIEIIRHRLFSICTFFMFNFFFIFAGNSFVQLLPAPLAAAFPVLIAMCSSFWLYRTWPRTLALYRRESLAIRLRKQLKKLNLNLGKFLEGQELDQLNASEVYVLAKVLPDFSQEKRRQTYKGVLKDAIADGYVSPANSLDNFQQLRQDLTVSDQDHKDILENLTQEHPELFVPNKSRSREDALRLDSYREHLLDKLLSSWKSRSDRRSMSSLMRVFANRPSIQALDNILKGLSKDDRAMVQSMRQVYGITSEDEADALRQTEPEHLWKTIAKRMGVLNDLKSGNDAQLRKIFQQIDTDNSGYISPAELKTYIQTIDPNLTTDQVVAMLNRADTNGDYHVSFEEFQSVFASLG